MFLLEKLKKAVSSHIFDPSTVSLSQLNSKRSNLDFIKNQTLSSQIRDLLLEYRDSDPSLMDEIKDSSLIISIHDLKKNGNLGTKILNKKNNLYQRINKYKCRIEQLKVNLC